MIHTILANLFKKSLSAFTNIHAHIEVFGHLWRSLRNIVSYSNGWEGESYIITYIGWKLTISFQKCMCLPQTIPSCYTTPLSNYNGFIHKRVPPSVLSHKGKWEKIEKGIDFADWLPDLSLINLATDSFSPWITEKLKFCYNHKKKLIISAHVTDASMSLASLRNNSSEVFLVLKSVF